MRRALLVLGLSSALGVLGAACADDDGGTAERAPETTLGGGSPSPDPVAADRQGWGEFDEGVLVVEPADPADDLLAWCVLVADTAEERARGLMDAPDAELGGYDGMAFTWDEDSVGGFWMKDTEVPLSIAYVDRDGGIVSTADMAPCPPDAETCPGYPAAGPYRLAVEVPQGSLPAMGIESGARLRVERRSCPSA